MDAVNVISSPMVFVRAKLADYAQLVKLRLSSLVVFSAAMAYLWAANRHIDLLIIGLISAGGFLVTGSANTLNQVIERDSDKLMKRTMNRPLPSGRMQPGEALIFAAIAGLAGLTLLYMVSSFCAVLGALAIVMYAGIYTPLKKITRFTIVPGAVAGSLPVVIGCVAATGKLTTGVWLLFLIQFIWQFPHTWSIAWLLDEEYKKAGIKIMPAESGRSRVSARIIMASTFFIIPMGIVFYMYNLVAIPAGCLLAFAGIGLAVFAYKLYRSQTGKSALGLMFGSFAYLPFVLIVLVITKFSGT